MKGTLHFNDITVPVEIDDPTEHMQAHWAKGAFYEANKRGMLPWIYANCLDLPEYWIDVGAAIGNHTLFFSVVCGKRTLAFEPMESSLRIALRNLDLNKANAIVYPYALGAEEKSVGVEQYHPDQIGMVRVCEGSAVEMRRLDDCIPASTPAIGLVKIDVEHYNVEVLTGARWTLETFRPWVFIECAEKDELARTDAVMNGYGYRLQNGVWNATPTYLWRPA